MINEENEILKIKYDRMKQARLKDVEDMDRLRRLLEKQDGVEIAAMHKDYVEIKRQLEQRERDIKRLYRMNQFQKTESVPNSEFSVEIASTMTSLVTSVCEIHWHERMDDLVLLQQTECMESKGLRRLIQEEREKSQQQECFYQMERNSLLSEKQELEMKYVALKKELENVNHSELEVWKEKYQQLELTTQQTMQAFRAIRGERDELKIAVQNKNDALQNRIVELERLVEEYSEKEKDLLKQLEASEMQSQPKSQADEEPEPDARELSVLRQQIEEHLFSKRTLQQYILRQQQKHQGQFQEISTQLAQQQKSYALSKSMMAEICQTLDQYMSSHQCTDSLQRLLGNVMMSLKRSHATAFS